VCELSGVGATIELSRLPLSPFAVEAMASLGLPSYACALGLGGDLQFLVTADRSQRAAFEDAGMYRVGTITDGRDVLAMHDDRRLSNLSRLGHEDGTTTSLVEEAGAVFEPFGD
jgi:thiamine monophosphate kinase